jgi:hypothetical protein
MKVGTRHPVLRCTSAIFRLPLHRWRSGRPNEFHAGGKLPGATAGFALADGASFGLAVGLSEIAAPKNMAPNDLTLQGSAGKTYVAAVTMRLVHEKKIGLDVIIRRTARGVSYGRLGFFPGYVTETVYFPESKIAIAMQVNTSAPRVTSKR